MTTDLRVSIPNIEVTTAKDNELAINSKYALLKCDLRKRPKNYGTVHWSIASMPVNTIKIIYSQPHGYSYIPSFISVWEYPVGTDPNQVDNSTFGVGDMSAANQFYVSVYTDSTSFNIIAYVLTDIGQGTLTNLSGTIRFYIYADDFTEV